MVLLKSWELTKRFVETLGSFAKSVEDGLEAAILGVSVVLVIYKTPSRRLEDVVEPQSQLDKFIDIAQEILTSFYQKTPEILQ